MKRLIPFVVVILLIIGCMLAPFLLFRPENYRKPLTDQLSKVFRHPVLIDKMEAHYFPPQLVLHQLNVLKGDQQNRYLTVDAVTLGLGWGALFGQSASPQNVEFSGAHVRINRLPSGAWDYSDWWPAGSTGHDKSTRPDITIKNSDLTWVDAFAPVKTELVMRGLNGQWVTASNALTLKGDVAGAAVPASFSFQANGPLGVGDWSGTATLTDNGRTAEFKLRRQGALWQVIGHSQEWRLDSAVALARFYARLSQISAGAGSSFLRDWKTDFTSIGTTTTFSHSAVVDGGTTEFKGTLQERAVMQLSVTAAVQNVPIASLKPLLAGLGEGLDGKLTGVISRFELAVSSTAWQSATGEFVFEIADGSYRFPDATLQALKKVKTARYLRKKFPEFDDKGFPFTKLRLQGMLERGGITLQQAGIVSGDVRAAVTGRLETGVQSLDLWLELQIHEVLPHLRKELPERYVVGEAGREKVQPIFGRMQGLWSDWKLRASPRSKVPGAALKTLRSGLAVN